MPILFLDNQEPEQLGLRRPALVAAFMGMPDAAVAASGAVRYLADTLSARPLAVWESEDYYDLVELRPISRVVPPDDRTLIWPHGEFWYARLAPPDADNAGPTGAADLLLFLGPEPRLRWRAFAAELAAMAQRCGVTHAVMLGAAFADVPHTRPPVVTGWATADPLRSRLDDLGIPFSRYEGPATISSAVAEAFRGLGVPAASLFGNGPHYLPLPNANVSLALLTRLCALLDFHINLQPLQEAGEQLTTQANRAMDEREDFREYVLQLEAKHQERAAPLAPGQTSFEQEEEAEEPAPPLNVDPQEVVRELEEFLRRRQQQGDDESQRVNE
jgi:predicted ATP-grasp superfamily ATP-dependent carboligase